MHPWTSRSLVAGLLVATLAAPATALAADPWPMVGGDPGHRGTADGPEPPFRVAWSVDLRDGDDVPVAPPVAGEDLVVVLTNDRAAALDPTDGSVLWEVDREPGAVGSPALTEELVLYASGTAGDAELVAAGRDDGAEVWRAALGGVSPGGVTVAGAAAFVGTRAGEVVAVELDGGEERWRFGAAGRVEGPPTWIDGLVLATGQDPQGRRATLHALDAEDGEEVWSVEISDIVGPSSAATAAGDLLVLGGGDLRLRALGPEEGALRWEAVARAPFPDRIAPALPGDVVAVDALGHVYRLDAATGEERWVFRVPGFLQTGSPVVAGGFVLVADDSGQLTAIDLEEGLLVWRHRVGERRLLGVAPAGDLVVAASEGGRVVAVEPDPDGALLEEPSPTTLFVGQALLNFAAAFVLTMVVLVGLFRVLRRRSG